MSQIVKINGVDHMIVQPSRPFMNSSMITNVLASGRKLGVNLSTGALVIVTPKPEKVFIFEYDGSKRKIASDRQVGLLQIEDQLDTLTKTLGNRVAKCDIKFYIKEDNKIVFLTSLIDNQQGEFLRQVGYAYSKFI